MHTIEKPAYCKSCFEQIKTTPIRWILENNPLLCDKCLSQIYKKLEVRRFHGVKILFLSEYKGIMKTWLMNYKEYGDVELAPCFLYPFLPVIRFLFRGCVFVPCPSSQNRIEKRGFDHLSYLLSASHLNCVSALEKTVQEEQKNAVGIHRLQDKGIRLTPSAASEIESKKIVLFDDVFTSGSTFLQSLEEIRKCHPKKIYGLILMDNGQLDNRKIKLS